MPDLTIDRVPEASHWVQADEPAAVSRRLVEFFDAAASPSGE